MNGRKITGPLILLLLLCLISGVVLAQGTVVIGRWSLNSGGGVASGGDVSLHSALGQAVAGSSSGGDVVLLSGFWSGGPAHTIYLPVTLRNYFVNPYEDNDSWENAYGPLAFGAEYRAYPDDDTDYYYFDLSATGNVTIRVENYQAIGDLILYRHRAGDEPEYVANWGKGGSTMTVGPLSLQPGKYYVRVYTAGGHNTASLYILTMTN